MAASDRIPIATDTAVEYGDLMAELGRRVGIGLAAGGDVREAAAWARRAEDLGIDSIWIHDSYFERDPITYLSAMGMETRRIGLGAGALNPYTRHPVVVAMTMSALDDLAPRRVTLALGSGLPRWPSPTTTRSRGSRNRSTRSAASGVVSRSSSMTRSLRCNRCFSRRTGSRSISPPTAHHSSTYAAQRLTATWRGQRSHCPRSRRCARAFWRVPRGTDGQPAISTFAGTCSVSSIAAGGRR